jgi:hypothetical protein
MASIASPYGLKPVNELGGLPYAGSTRQYVIDPAGTAANIYNGSPVYVNASGYLAVATATGADATTNGFPVGTANTGIVGVFVGCQYINAQGQVIYSQYYPTGTTGVVNAYVVDDPQVIFQVQSAGQVTQAAVGSNLFFSTGAVATGSTTTGNSTASVVAGSSAVTTTAAFRVVGFPNMVGFSVVGDAFTDVFVKINPGYHSYTNAVGL